MARSLTIQTLGSALVPSLLLLSQAIRNVLDAYPSSPTAWYLHLAVFAPLQQVRSFPSPLAALLDRAEAGNVVLVLLLIGAVRIARFRLGVAILAHLAFGASVLVAHAWMMGLHGSIAPGLLLVREASGTALIAMLLAATGLACALAHASFLRDIVRTRGDRTGGLPRSLQSSGRGVPGHRVPTPGMSPAT